MTKWLHGAELPAAVKPQHPRTVSHQSADFWAESFSFIARRRAWPLSALQHKLQLCPGMTRTLDNSYLCCRPLHDNGVHNAGHTFVQKLHQLQFIATNTRVFIQAVGHSVMTPCRIQNKKCTENVYFLTTQDHNTWLYCMHTPDMPPHFQITHLYCPTAYVGMAKRWALLQRLLTWH